MAISERSPLRHGDRIMMAWPAAMMVYLTLWSAGLGWVTYWWAWLFVLLSLWCGWRTRCPAVTPQRAADGFVLPRVHVPTSHRARARNRGRIDSGRKLLGLSVR
ncbi:MAG: hypothetical protein ACRDSL_23855 [Pseudonocardiaceae bacterium]